MAKKKRKKKSNGNSNGNGNGKTEFAKRNKSLLGYNAIFTPSSDGQMVIRVVAGVFSDAAGNSSQSAAKFSWFYDATKPNMEITASNGTDEIEDVSSKSGLIKGGDNVLALQAMNRSSSGSDFVVGVELLLCVIKSLKTP